MTRSRSRARTSFQLFGLIVLGVLSRHRDCVDRKDTPIPPLVLDSEELSYLAALGDSGLPSAGTAH